MRKSGGDGGSKAVKEGMNQAVNSLREGRIMGYQALDAAQTGSLNDLKGLINPAKKITQSAFDKVAGYDQFIPGEVQRVQAAYMEPAQRQVQETLKNLFRSGGVGGGNNSRVQNYISRNAQEMQLNEAQRQYELENQVKNQFLQEQQGLYQFGNQPIADKRDVLMDIGQNKANVATGTGTALANTFLQGGSNLANIQSANQQRRSSGKGAGVGAIGGLVGNIVGAKGK